MLVALRRWVGFATPFCGISLLASAAVAQTDVKNLPPPAYTYTDARGVDLTTLDMSTSTTAVSIGSASHGLSMQFNFFGDGSTTVVDQGLPLPGGGGFYQIYGGGHFVPSLLPRVDCHNGTANSATLNICSITGPVSETFVSSPTDSQVGQTGGRFVGNTYIAKDGTTIDLGDLTVTRPDGEVLKYYNNSGSQTLNGIAGYPYSRLQTITSSLGYQIHFDYDDAGGNPSAIKGAVAFNAAVDYCDPYAFSCTFSQQWPKLTIGSSQAGDRFHWVQTVTDNQNNQSAYWAAVGQGLFQLLRPAAQQTSPTTVVTRSYVKANNQIASVITDGPRSWQYHMTQVLGAGWSGPENGVATVTDPLSRHRTLNLVTSNPDLGNLTDGRVQSDTDELGNTTSFLYDAAARITDVTHPELDRDHYDYDGYGNITGLTKFPKPGSAEANAGQAIAIHASYANCGNPKICAQPDSYTDARNNTTYYTYDPNHGGVTSITSPAPNSSSVSPVTHIDYVQVPTYAKGSGGSIVQVGTVWRVSRVWTCRTGACPAGSSMPATSDVQVTTYVYGGPSAGSYHGEPTSITVQAGDGASDPFVTPSTTSFTYNGFGAVDTVTGPAGAQARTIYDNMGRTSYEIGPDFAGNGHHATTYTHYAPDGQVDQSIQGFTVGGDPNQFNPISTTTTTYDLQDFTTQEATSSTDGRRALTQYSYDPAGRPNCTAVRLSPSAYGSEPGACTPGPSGVDGPDRVTQIVYDDTNHQVTTQQGVGTPAARAYDKVTYGPNGEQTAEMDANSHQTSYGYDGYGRLVSITYPDGSSEGISLDANGNPVDHRLRDGNHTYPQFDALDRPSLTESGAHLTYDNLGDLASAVSAGGQTTASTYDALGRLTTEGGPSGAMSYQYDVAGRRTKITWPGTDGFFVTYSYLPGGPLSQISDSSSTILTSYSYDDFGRISQVGRANGVGSSYVFDGFSQLSSFGHGFPLGVNPLNVSFVHSPAGQIRSRTLSNASFDWGPTPGSRNYMSNNLNQLTQSGPYVPLYGDGRGNMTNDGAGNAYGYSLANQLTAYDVPGQGAHVDLTYDGLNRLAKVAKTAPTSSTTVFAYSGDQVVAEYKADGTLLRRYVPGPAASDDPVAWFEGSGVGDRRWFYQDERGSVIATTNGTGALIDASGAPTVVPNSYDEYGLPAGTTADQGSGGGLNANVGRFQYTGQMWIPEIGLYYYKARFYSPKLGRFMQTDPIGYTGDLNLYAYVGNDPINGIDPSGERVVCSSTSDIQGEDGSSGVQGNCQIWPDGDIANLGQLGFTTTGQASSAGPQLDKTLPKMAFQGQESCSSSRVPITGSGSLRVTFDSPKINQSVNPVLAKIIESLGDIPGIHSIQMSSTTGGHTAPDPHVYGNAGDIARVNGLHVGDARISSLVGQIQSHAMGYGQTYNSLGPSGIFIRQRNGSFQNMAAQLPSLARAHARHVHIGVGCP